MRAKSNSSFKTKPVVQYDKNRNFVAIYQNKKEASEETKTSEVGILNSCTYRQDLAGKCWWRFLEPNQNLEDVKKPLSKRCIIQFDKKTFMFIRFWLNAKEIKQELGLDPSSISKCCRYKRAYGQKIRTCGNYIWDYDREYAREKRMKNHYKEQNEIKKEKKEEKMKEKAICQYDLEGNFIARWNSLTEAVQNTGATKSGISSCCTHHLKTSFHFIWKYAVEVKKAKRVPAKKLEGQIYKQVDLFNVFDNLGSFIDTYETLEQEKETPVPEPKKKKSFFARLFHRK